MCVCVCVYLGELTCFKTLPNLFVCAYINFFQQYAMLISIEMHLYIY